MTTQDRKYGTPCLVCGAPILQGIGHDAGCMAAGRCKAYFYGRGMFRIAGRRCESLAGHDGQHTCYRSGLGAPFSFRWGRAR